ncbi:sugar ABC transporter permease, partial [Bacteroides thetaiotaomicron]|nr:sugar ABC transporter permease [Bacteroides thetaiotaomicron]
VVTVAGAVLVGIALAVFLFERVHGRWRRFASLVLIMPVLLPRVSAAFIWKFMYAPLTGILSWLLGTLGVENTAFLA